MRYSAHQQMNATWLATVGSAVGLGNLWRFPCAVCVAVSSCFRIFVALFFGDGTQQLALGHKHRSGHIDAFGRMNWRLRGIGLASVIGAFGIVMYYMIIGISTVFFESFMAPLRYAEGNIIHTGTNYLYMDVLLLDRVSFVMDGSSSVISGKLYLATCLCWVLTFLCISKGVKSASWPVRVTTLPFRLLFILLIKRLTLDGAWRGIKAYWNLSNCDDLSESTIWNDAVGQCFFSLSICMCVKTAYGSGNPLCQDIGTAVRESDCIFGRVCIINERVCTAYVSHKRRQSSDAAFMCCIGL
eukprot:462759_1